MNSTGTTASTGFLANMEAWFNQPFSTQGSALNWVLFVGLLLVAVMLWQFVLIDLTADARAVLGDV
jgi:hypothetical protein